MPNPLAKLKNTGSDAKKVCHDRTPQDMFPASERDGERTAIENRSARRGRGNCLQNSRGQWAKVPDEDFRTRGGQGGLTSPCAAVGFQTVVACDAPTQAGANQDREQPARENRRADRGSDRGTR